jgi:hypothetical protein
VSNTLNDQSINIPCAYNGTSHPLYYIFSPQTVDGALVTAQHKLHYVKPDGQCGFRSLAVAIYGHEDSWQRIKTDMLQYYLQNAEKYRNFFGYEDEEILPILQDLQSPCAPSHWFYTPDCAQIAADRYCRTIAIYDASMDASTSCLFIPVVPTVTDHIPIRLFLKASHFWMVEHHCLGVESMKWPPVNPQYQPIVRRLGYTDVSELYCNKQ